MLGLPLAGVSLRMMRASMAEVLDEDYLRTAMAKGLRTRTVVRRHAVPSAVAPVFMLTTVTMPIVVTNLVLIEQVFNIRACSRECGAASRPATSTSCSR